MTKEEAIQRLKEKLPKKKAELSTLNNQLKSYESDFAILVNAEEELAQSSSILEYYRHVESALSVSIENIVDLGTKDIIPGFEELFTNFDNFISDTISRLSSTSSDYLEEINKAGTEIDAAKEEIAHKIEELKREISTCEAEIEKIEQLLYSM